MATVTVNGKSVDIGNDRFNCIEAADCPVCDKAGECKLQDYSYEFGNAESRMIDVKNTPPNKPDISSKIALFTDRCILCTRCVRFTREVAGTAELTVVSRGTHSEIDI